MSEQRKRPQGDRRAVGPFMWPEFCGRDVVTIYCESLPLGCPRCDRAVQQGEDARMRGPRPQHKVVPR